MAMIAQLTISGLVNYYPSLFDNLLLPTPPTDASAIGLQADQLRTAWTIDKDQFINFLGLRCMGMCLAYPDATFMKAAIGTWSAAHIEEWQRLFDTLFYKYNPLWNKDGKIMETGVDTHNITDNLTQTGESTGNNTNTGYTHAYDGGTTHTDDNLTWTHAEKQKGNATANTTNLSSRVNNDTINTAHTRIEQGNIGVTMTQELITKEREVALFSIEEFIADEFAKNFCLMIW